MKTSLMMVIAFMLLLASCGEKCISDKKIIELLLESTTTRDSWEDQRIQYAETIDKEFYQMDSKYKLSIYEVFAERGLVTISKNENMYKCELTELGKQYLVDEKYLFYNNPENHYEVWRGKVVIEVLEKKCTKGDDGIMVADVKFRSYMESPTPFYIKDEHSKLRKTSFECRFLLMDRKSNWWTRMGKAKSYEEEEYDFD